ncbi:toprim domain-containing protein [uncultured Bacteroides sp.]|uniref:toprim domain-containing protein n=1 Tax=uncultured Bacteroides sp. TaxID=162156 RepID=UPI00321FA647
MNIDEIRQIPLVDFLNHLGYQPTGRDSKGLWFYSPLRSERKPSFHVNPKKNLWYDFGSGNGGDIFSLAGEIAGTTDFIRQAEFIAEKMQMPVEKPYKPILFKEEPTFSNVEISKLEHPALLKYLADRGIPKEIAQRHCVQVDYELHGKAYYAIGFENMAHGFELRNPFFKGSFPPKAISHFVKVNARCCLYEGFIDFLSGEKFGFNDYNDVIVLNSVANIGKAIPMLNDYSVMLCFFDNDAAGQAAFSRLEKEFGTKVCDKSSLYPNHKDLNDYLMAQIQKQNRKPRLKL